MRIVMDRDVMVSMRDGTRLATDVYRPDSAARLPVLLVRLAYGKNTLTTTLSGTPMPDLLRLVSAGYAVVAQDSRGTFASEGDFDPLADETSDGVDLLRWVTAQPWSNGRIGTYGLSYLGMTQWLLAGENPGELLAIAPGMTSGDSYLAPFYSRGGVFQLASALTWSLMMAAAETQRALVAGEADPGEFATLADAMSDVDRYQRRLPLHDQPVLDRRAPWYRTWLSHPDRDTYWADRSSMDYSAMTVPTFGYTGWYDALLGTTIEAYVGMRHHGGSSAAREGARLIIGPWTHSNASGGYPQRQFGLAADAATLDFTDLHLRHFDTWLRPEEVTADEHKRVRLFVMGIDQWRDEEDWPLPDTRYTDFHLDSAGAANTADGDGLLTREPATAQEQDAYLYDPRRPVPTTGGQILAVNVADDQSGPADQRSVEARQDVLCYTTSPLTAAQEVTGPIELVLHVSSTARDTDFMATLVDVHPDGRAMLLTDGALRARYRKSPSEAEPLEPGQIHEIRIDLGATSNVFLPGHRIRLDITSSNFPRYDRNTNTGGVIAEESEKDFVRAVNHIHHGPRHRSRLILPLIERNSDA